MNRLIIPAVLLLLLASCAKKKTLSPIPVIAFSSLEPESITSGSSEDTAYLTFTVADGDADLGTGTGDVFLKDSRDTVITIYPFPDIPAVARDPAIGMQGSCTIQLLAVFLTPRADSLHMATGDTLHYEVYIKDQAGHESNHITTTDLIIRP